MNGVMGGGVGFQPTPSPAGALSVTGYLLQLHRPSRAELAPTASQITRRRRDRSA